MSSWDEVNNPQTPLKRMKEIAGSDYYQAQEQAMWKIVERFPSSQERDQALATIVNVSGYKTSNIRQVAAQALLKSSTATNNELVRVVLHADDNLKQQAAKRMIVNGELTDFERKTLETWVPELMEAGDSEGKKFQREAFSALTGSPRQKIR